MSHALDQHAIIGCNQRFAAALIQVLRQTIGWCSVCIGAAQLDCLHIPCRVALEPLYNRPPAGACNGILFLCLQ